MSSYIKISQLNTLTFRNVTPGTYQTFHNTVDYDEDYINHVGMPVFQHFDIGDNIVIQIASNNTLKKCILVNADTAAETDLTAAVAGYSTAWSTIESFVTTNYDTVYYYQKTLYTSLLSGYYWVRLEFDSSADYKISEIFRVHNCDADTVLYQWTNSETGLRKGIYFDGTQTFGCRLDARFVKFEPGINVITNESFNNKLEALQSNALFYATLELGGLPRHLIEKINVSLQVDTKTINGTQYEVESGLESEQIVSRGISTNLYTGSLKFRLYDYERYPDFEAEEEVETYYLLADDFNEGDEEYLLINSTDIILIE